MSASLSTIVEGLRQVADKLEEEQPTVDEFAVLDALANDVAVGGTILDAIAANYPYGLLTRLLAGEGKESNRTEAAKILSGFLTLVPDEDDDDTVDEKIRERIGNDGFYSFVEDFDLEADTLEWVLDYREDEVVERLRSDGTIPDFDIDDIRYTVREIQGQVENLANEIGS